MAKIGQGMLILYLLLSQISGCAEQDTPQNMAIGTTVAGISLVCQSLMMSYIDRGKFPENEIELANVVTNPNSGYLRPGALVDGWKQPLHYRRESENDVAVWSFGGADKRDEQAIGCSLSIDPNRSIVTEKHVNVFLHSETEVKRSFSDYARK